MRPIFISYRRQDSEGEAGRLFDDLKSRFGEKFVFMDVEALEYGRDFRKELEDSVAGCGVLLAIIGKSWLEARDSEGNLRLNSPEDFVHRETAAALQRDIPVIPVLVRGAVMPRADQLPEPLKNLAFRNAVELTHARWSSDLNLLVQALQRTLAVEAPPAHPAPKPRLSRNTMIAAGAILLLTVVVIFGSLLGHKTSDAPASAPIAAGTSTPANGPSPDKDAAVRAGSTPARLSSEDPSRTAAVAIPDARPATAGTDAIVPPSSSNAPAAVAANTVLYALSDNNDLLWYSHTGRNDGSPLWADTAGRKVGTNWNFKQLFSGGDGVIYGVTPENDLMWFRHTGRTDGSFRWATAGGRKVGDGWNFKHIFSGGGGVIYAINDKDELLWFRHDGHLDGSYRWSATAGKVVGRGWNVKHIFYGGDGVIYTIDPQNRLLWYRHDGRNDGTPRWAASEGRQVGVGWDVLHVFSSGDGIIYILNDKRQLMWYHHTGFPDGDFRWEFADAKIVGTGWSAKQLFSGADLRP